METATGAARSTLLRDWVACCVAGEAVGFAAPAAAGVAVYAASIGAAAAMGLFVIAGAIEGLVLGLAQQVALRRHIVGFEGGAWARNTALAAAFAWGLGMTPGTLGEGFFEHAWVYVPALVAGGPLLLLSIGFGQWLVLRRSVAGAWAWIGISAGAWLAAIPMVFVAMAFVSEGDPAWRVAVAGAAGGVLMAGTMAAVSGAGLVWLLAEKQGPPREAAYAGGGPARRSFPGGMQ